MAKSTEAFRVDRSCIKLINNCLQEIKQAPAERVLRQQSICRPKRSKYVFESPPKPQSLATFWKRP